MIIYTYNYHFVVCGACSTRIFMRVITPHDVGRFCKFWRGSPLKNSLDRAGCHLWDFLSAKRCCYYIHAYSYSPFGAVVKTFNYIKWIYVNIRVNYRINERKYIDSNKYFIISDTLPVWKYLRNNYNFIYSYSFKTLHGCYGCAVTGI